MNKNGKHEYPVAVTADGSTFAYRITYFFFDEDTEEIRNTSGLRRINLEAVGSMGYPVITIAKLHPTKEAAIEVGQKFFLAEIERLRTAIRKFEGEKAPKNRSLKAELMARG